MLCTGIGGLIGGLLAAIAKGILSGALIGGLLGGLSSLASGGSFLDGFINGAFTGALTGALFGGIFGSGQVLGQILCKLSPLVGTVLNFIASGATIFTGIATGMAAFDLLSFGVGLFDASNPLVQFNQSLHSNSLYNAFQFGISALAAFGGGLNSGRMMPGAVCFIAGTMILTANGLVAIENIKTGDKVISTNPETFETAKKTVLETYIRQTTELVHLTINGEQITTTGSHPFYVKDIGFISARELNIGDKLLDSNRNVIIVEDIKFETTDMPTTVYNFQVENFHTYYVGQNSILVHNMCNNDSGKIIRENNKKGIKFQNVKFTDLKKYNPTAQPQVVAKPLDSNGNPLKTGGNYFDAITLDPCGNIYIIEYKNSLIPSYTHNQYRNGFSTGSLNKDLMIMKDYGPFKAGDIIPKDTPIITITPADSGLLTYFPILKYVL